VVVVPTKYCCQQEKHDGRQGGEKARRLVDEASSEAGEIAPESIVAVTGNVRGICVDRCGDNRSDENPRCFVHGLAALLGREQESGHQGALDKSPEGTVIEQPCVGTVVDNHGSQFRVHGRALAGINCLLTLDEQFEFCPGLPRLIGQRRG
jgi:hypothetical protein